MSNTVNKYTETDLGNISLNPRGEYDNLAAYEYLDTVSYRGGSYFCLAELETTITGIAPDAGHNSEHWQMIAAPGDMTPEYTTAYNDVINKAVQVESSRAAVELAQQEIETSQADVQELHSDTVQAAQEAENSKNSAANSAQSAEQSRKTVSESEQNINGQIAGFDSRVSEAVEQSKEEINTTKQQAINTITNQQTTSVNTVKTEGEKIITRVGNDAKTVADDRATVEEAAQTVLNNAQEVAQNTQTVASNTENAAASAESAKTSADNAAQSAKGVEDASKQIEQNKKDVASLKEDLTSKADKTSLAQTDRKLDALWKLNQGISYEFQTDDTEAYQKTVPSGAKVANVKSIGGKTIVWNQLFNFNTIKTTTVEEVTFTNNGDGTYTANGTASEESFISIAITFTKGHMYYMRSLTTIASSGTYKAYVTGNNIFAKIMDLGYGAIDTATVGGNGYFVPLYISKGTTVENLKIAPKIIDLTQMFGSGNEPSTVEELKAMFPSDYYPYNAGELMSAPVNEVTYSDIKTQETSYQIPQAILNLPGYGWSTGNVRNEVDFENKKYIQRVGKYVITDSETFMTTYAPVITFLNKRHLIKRSSKAINNQGLSIFSANEKGDIWQFLISDIGLDEDATVDDIKEWFKVHPVTSYYPMLNEEITNISDLIGDTFQEPLEVEVGGTLTFKNSNGDDCRIPVPSSEEYVISLTEAAK